jgi:hypothetical protein
MPADVEDGSWSFILEPSFDRTTRFLIRGRGPQGRSLGWAAFDQAIFEPMHFVVERGMMVGLKERAEGSRWPFLWNDLHVVLWTVVLGLLLVAAVKVFRGADWGRALGGFVLSCVVFQILTLAQPPIVVFILLVAVLVAIPWWPKGRDSEHSALAMRPPA